MKVSVPTEEYAEKQVVGNRCLVRLEPVEAEDRMTECWETVDATSEPDIAAIMEELQAWKQHLAEVELVIAKRTKVQEIEAYDASEAVNSFAIVRNGEKLTDYWIPRDLRSSLEGDVLAASEVSDTYTFDIRELGISLVLPCNWFLAALSRLRRYAYTAYNVTSAHIAAVIALTSVGDVRAYDYTLGYPERLTFDIAEA